MNCETCAERKKQVEPVPYIVHESAMARQERTNKRLWILAIIVFLAFVISNGAWIWHKSQFEDVYVEQEVDTGEGAAYVAGVGDVYYGESQTDGKGQTP